MQSICRNCQGAYSGPIHWYKVRPNSREIIYRCRKVGENSIGLTQEEVVVQARKRFLKLWAQVRQKHLQNETCPEQLYAAYQDARAAMLVAQGAMNEEFSKYAS